MKECRDINTTSLSAVLAATSCANQSFQSFPHKLTWNAQALNKCLEGNEREHNPEYLNPALFIFKVEFLDWQQTLCVAWKQLAPFPYLAPPFISMLKLTPLNSIICPVYGTVIICSICTDYLVSNDLAISTLYTVALLSLCWGVSVREQFFPKTSWNVIGNVSPLMYLVYTLFFWFLNPFITRYLVIK